MPVRKRGVRFRRSYVRAEHARPRSAAAFAHQLENDLARFESRTGNGHADAVEDRHLRAAQRFLGDRVSLGSRNELCDFLSLSHTAPSQCVEPFVQHALELDTALAAPCTL